jgi:hypothetical protein
MQWPVVDRDRDQGRSIVDGPVLASSPISKANQSALSQQLLQRPVGLRPRPQQLHGSLNNVWSCGGFFVQAYRVQRLDFRNGPYRSVHGNGGLWGLELDLRIFRRMQPGVSVSN